MAVRTTPRRKPRRNHRRNHRRPVPAGGRGRRPGPRARRRQRGPVVRFLRRFWWLYGPVVLAFLTGVGAFTYLWVTTPIPSQLPLAQTTFLYDRHGNFLTGLDGPEERTLIPLAEVPEHLKRAVIAAEDQRFETHPGVSPMDMIRAAWADLNNRSIEQGASTITQQLVRNSLEGVGTERTFSRKIKEAILALKLERELDKDEILERYLNTIYLGSGAFGVQAASRLYFGKAVKDVNVVEAATLAGIISRPEAFTPLKDPVATKIRRDWVLDRMAALGYVSPGRAVALQAKPVRIRPQVPEDFAGNPAAWFIDYARQYLSDPATSPLENPEQETFEGGLRVRTTVDSKWQRAAIQAIRNHYGEPGDPDVALVAIDPTRGAIRAVASSSRYTADPEGRLFHPATFGCDLDRGCGRKGVVGGTGRQTGSAFKVFTVAAAVDQDISLRSTFSGRSPFVIDDPTCYTNNQPWDPENYGGSQFGTMDLLSATASSVNVIFAQLISEVGPENVVKVAHRLGIKSYIPPVCAITLGAAEVNVLEMTNAFATLASGGIRHEPTPIAAIRTADGELVWRNTGEGRRVMEENDAWQVVYALQRVVTGGTASGALSGIGFPAFGKTGTEDDTSDAWFCGGTTPLVACVWVGHHENQLTPTGLTGGGGAAPVWRDFMVVAQQDLEAGEFPVPELTGKPIAGPSPSPSPTPSPKPPRERETPEPEPSPEPTSRPRTPPPPSPKPEPKPSPSPPPPSPSPSPPKGD